MSVPFVETVLLRLRPFDIETDLDPIAAASANPPSWSTFPAASLGTGNAPGRSWKPPPDALTISRESFEADESAYSLARGQDESIRK